MTTILLSTGAQINLADMNLHDLGQYCMYQMDMLGKANDPMDCLGIERWTTGELLNPTINVNLKATTPAAFQEPCLPGNAMPTHYDGGTWQGVVTGKDGLKNYPAVENISLNRITKQSSFKNI